MYKLIIVDDEPPVVRRIRRIITEEKMSFEIVGEFYNGEEALRFIKENKVDVVLADVIMPLMDGVKLASNISQVSPYTHTIIISGYADFEYAKGALKAGVADYLLKPLNVESFTECIENVIKKLDMQYYEKIGKVLSEIIIYKNKDIPIIDEYQSQLFYAILINNFNNGIRELDLKEMIEEKKQCPEFGANQYWLFSPSEYCYYVILANTDYNADVKINDFAYSIYQTLSLMIRGVSVVAYSSRKYSIGSLSPGIKKLEEIINYTVITPYQIICDDKENYGISAMPAIEKALEKRLKIAIENHSYQQFIAEIKQIIDNWKQINAKKIQIIKTLYLIINWLLNEFARLTYNNSIEFENEIEVAVKAAGDYNQLTEKINSVYKSIFDLNKSTTIGNTSTAGLAKSIEAYIIDHFNEQISLNSIANKFHISESYVNKLLLRYVGKPFKKYLTDIRILEAKNIIKKYPDMLLQDVARTVGYTDSHYFSKVFKISTGDKPSRLKGTDK